MNASLLRPLGPTEALVLRVQRAHSLCATAYNIVCHVQMRTRQPLTAATLRAATTTVIARQPLLCARIVPWRGGYAFVAGSPETAFTLIEEAGGDWRSAMTRGIRTPWDAAAPLVRLTLLPQSATVYDFVLNVHHALMDGMSLFHFVQELLEALAGGLAAAPPQRVAPDIWDCRPPQWGSPWRHLPAVLRTYLQTPLSPRVYTFPFDGQQNAPGQNGYYCHAFTPTETATILARAKQAAVSVGAFIGATLVAAVSESPAFTPVGLSMMVDLRRRAATPISAAEIGHCASQVQTYYEVPSGAALTPLAREVQRKVQRELASGIHWAVGTLVRYGYPLLTLPLRYGPQPFPYSLILSNVGAIPLPATIGALTVQQCHAGGDLSFVRGGVFVALSTFQGQMTCDITLNGADPTVFAAYWARVQTLLAENVR